MIMNTALEDPAGNRLNGGALLPDGAGPFEGGLEYCGDVDFYGPIFGDALAASVGRPDGERLPPSARRSRARPGDGAG